MARLVALPALLLAGCASVGGGCEVEHWGDLSCQADREPERPPAADGVPPVSDERQDVPADIRARWDTLISEGYPEDVARDLARRSAE